jgi:hypothetical protein
LYGACHSMKPSRAKLYVRQLLAFRTGLLRNLTAKYT